MQTLPSPESDIIKIFESALRNFIWEGKKSKVSLDRLKHRIEKGGLTLIDIVAKDQSLMAAKYLKICKQDKQQLSSRLLAKVLNIPLENFQASNIHYKDIVKGPKFFTQVATAWCKIMFEKPRNRKEVMEQPIWYNSNIRSCNKQDCL